MLRFGKCSDRFSKQIRRGALSTGASQYWNSSVGFHLSCKSYLSDKQGLPGNVEEINASEKTSFSPQRNRDLSGSVIVSQMSGTFGSGFLNDQGMIESATTDKIDSRADVFDDHLENYDSTGVVSLNSVMQSTVPEPYEKSPSHLNMPGAGWGKGQKYVSQDLQDTHFQTLDKQMDGNGGKPVE